MARLSLDLSHTITQAVSRHSQWASHVFMLMLETFFLSFFFLALVHFSILSYGRTKTFCQSLQINVLPPKRSFKT